MRFLVLLLCAVSVVNASLIGRIVGGNDVVDGKFPYQTSIRYRKIHTCGGSIVNSRHILTAAHCIYRRDPVHFTVVVGSIYLNKGGVPYLVESTLWPSTYDDVKVDNDIGLLRLTEHIEFYSTIQPIVLPYSYYVPEGETAIVTGWGRLNKTGVSPITLQELSAVVISQSLCEQYYWRLTKNNICTYTKKDEGVCFGDSGSPLVLNGIQIGIVSNGRPCATGIPDVYTRVYPYLKWIEIASQLPATCEIVNAAHHVHLNILIVLSLAILTIVSYGSCKIL